MEIWCSYLDKTPETSGNHCNWLMSILLFTYYCFVYYLYRSAHYTSINTDLYSLTAKQNGSLKPVSKKIIITKIISVIETVGVYVVDWNSFQSLETILWNPVSHSVLDFLLTDGLYERGFLVHCHDRVRLQWYLSEFCAVHVYFFSNWNARELQNHVTSEDYQKFF